LAPFPPDQRSRNAAKDGVTGDTALKQAASTDTGKGKPVTPASAAFLRPRLLGGEYGDSLSKCLSWGNVPCSSLRFRSGNRGPEDLLRDRLVPQPGQALGHATADRGKFAADCGNEDSQLEHGTTPRLGPTANILPATRRGGKPTDSADGFGERFGWGEQSRRSHGRWRLQVFVRPASR
jgi:hypothetical protein